MVIHACQYWSISFELTHKARHRQLSSLSIGRKIIVFSTKFMFLVFFNYFGPAVSCVWPIASLSRLIMNKPKVCDQMLVKFIKIIIYCFCYWFPGRWFRPPDPTRSSRKTPEIAGTWKQYSSRTLSAFFSAGILLPRNHRNYPESAVSGPDCSTWLCTETHFDDNPSSEMSAIESSTNITRW